MGEGLQQILQGSSKNSPPPWRNSPNFNLGEGPLLDCCSVRFALIILGRFFVLCAHLCKGGDAFMKASGAGLLTVRGRRVRVIFPS